LRHAPLPVRQARARRCANDRRERRQTRASAFHQLTATEWRINSADGSIHDVITLAVGTVIDTTTDIMFV
jgi:hypothetical protein